MPLSRIVGLPWWRAFSTLLVAVALGGLCPAPARADLCNSAQDTSIPVENVVDLWLHNELFPDTGYRGNDHWNQVVLRCNRKRDTKGNEILKVTGTDENSAEKRTLKADNLEPKVIRGHYNFHGFIAEQQKYVYILSKSKGVWRVILPYEASINDLAEDRVDFYMGSRGIKKNGSLEPIAKSGHAWDLYDESQVSQVRGAWRLDDPDNAKPIAETLCGPSSSVYLAGKEDRYEGKSGAESYKRDDENKHISRGRISYGYKDDDYIRLGCRVKDNRDIYWRPNPEGPRVVKTTPETFIFENFIRTAEQHWTLPGVFELEVYLRGFNDSDFKKSELNLLKDRSPGIDVTDLIDPTNQYDAGDFYTVYFATKFLPYHYNQMYKSNIIQFNNFSTMTTDGTYWHEVGHALGLDDEYGKTKKDDTAKDNGCEYSGYQQYDPLEYQMCKAGSSPDDYKKCAAVQGEACGDPRTIYYYIATSRYILQCRSDEECPAGKYCDKGWATIGKNQCLTEKKDNEPCDVIGGGHQCEGKHCAWGRCYTPYSVRMGGVCYLDKACKEGKCTAIDGFKGVCVCKRDEDCPDNKWCNAGLDLVQNKCEPKKKDNEPCAAVGGAHQCLGGHCAWSRCYTPKSVDMGGLCYIDNACKKGKCTAIDGFRGVCVCKDDEDCGPDQWCNGGLDLARNVCEPLKKDNEPCAAAGGAHQCEGGHCAWGKCYTPNSVGTGGTCYVDAACKKGKCTAIDGFKGECVCKNDNDCDNDEWCDAGLDLKTNKCKKKLKKGESCGKAGSFGNDHKCKSGKCSGFPNYKCK